MRAAPGTVLESVDAALRKQYGATRRRKRPMLDVLIETVLSQNTNDANSHRAFIRLKRAFPGWHQVRTAPAAAIARAIRTGGLANIKARRIRELLDAIADEQGKPDLSFLRIREREDAYQRLLLLPGVGPKTAACTLLFGAGIPVFPVDTHVIRIARRLGWARPKESPAMFQERFRQAVPDAVALSLHINLIQLGRTVCHPRNPSCPVCPIRSFCQLYNRRERP